MKKILLILVVLLVVGCNDNDRKPIHKPYTFIKHKELCIGGVVYYMLGRSMAVAYNVDGSLILCDDNLN